MRAVLPTSRLCGSFGRGRLLRGRWKVNPNLSALSRHIKDQMPVCYTGLWGNVSLVMPTPCLTLWMCGNEIYWMYRPTQNTTIIINTFYRSQIYSRNFYSCSPWRQRAVLQSPRLSCQYWTMTRKELRGDPYGYARIGARNCSINIFRTCYATRANSFRCAGNPTRIVRSWNVLIARFVIDYANNLFIKILSDIWTFVEICHGLQWHGSFDDWYGALACDRFGRPRHMGEEETSMYSLG